MVAIVSFGFFGIEEAGVEIEDPFGLDDNCLPLDALCVGIIRDSAQITQAFSAAEPNSDGHQPVFVGNMPSVSQITTPQLKL